MNALSPRHLQIVERWTLILSALLVVAMFLLAPRQLAFAATIGAGLMAVNAWAIRKLGERLFRRAEEGKTGLAVLLFNAKMLALIALVYVALRVFHLDAIGFLLGVSVFPVAIVVAALRINLGSEPEGSDAPFSGDQ